MKALWRKAMLPAHATCRPDAPAERLKPRHPRANRARRTTSGELCQENRTGSKLLIAAPRHPPGPPPGAPSQCLTRLVYRTLTTSRIELSGLLLSRHPLHRPSLQVRFPQMGSLQVLSSQMGPHSHFDRSDRLCGLVSRFARAKVGANRPGES